MAERIYTENAPAAIGPYSQAVVVNGMVYSSGQIAIVPSTGNIEAADIKGQTTQVMENLKAVLTAAGTSMDKIVKTTCFLADIADFAAFNTSEKRSRRPMKRTRTPSLISSGVSLVTLWQKSCISASTSSCGRPQFSVEKV